jgi:uncharacterized DUF497 family protein
MKEIISGSFEWDAEKNQANKEKHGIGFEEAIKAFEEPYLRFSLDIRPKRVGLP